MTDLNEAAVEAAREHVERKLREAAPNLPFILIKAFAEVALDAIKAYEAALWSDDMDAAPKDGRMLRLCRMEPGGACVFLGEGYYLDGQWLLLRIKALDSVEPTHWAPRQDEPAPPQTGRQG